ncbi:membrane protein [soil metagenome]
MSGSARLERNRTILRILLAVAYAFVGFVHIRSPGGFLAIIPDWVPYPQQVILITGICEILGAIALMTKRLRYLAGVMLAAYAVCVFPANIRHAFEGIVVGHTKLGWGYHAPRLLFQPVIIWWALFAGGITDWPFRKRKAQDQ